MDIVLGVSIAATSVRMLLVEGENADGVTVEEDIFQVAAADDMATPSTSAQVIAAILGTRQGAAEGGHRLMSTGVTWTEPSEVAVLRDALAAREIRNVMLVSPLLAAAALAQTVGHATGYASTALLFVEANSATLAVVDTSDGSIVDLHRRHVQGASYGAEVVSELVVMITALDRLESPPGGVFVVGCGVDIVPIKPQLEAVVSLPVSAAEEPDMALARGAALASANAPLFASSTAALAYAQDPGTGEVNPDALSPTYLDVCANAKMAGGALAYSAVFDEEETTPRRRPSLLVGSGVAAVLVIGLAALVISLVASVHPTAGHLPGGHPGLMPTKQAPPTTYAPAMAAPAPPAASAPAPPPPAPPQTVPAPTPLVQQSPQRVVTPVPVHRTPARQAPAYVPPVPQEAPAYVPPAAPPPPPPPAAPPLLRPPARQLPPMVLYLHLPFVTVPIPIYPPPPPAPPGP